MATPTEMSIDRALAALDTPGGERRVKAHLVGVAANGSRAAVEVDELARALEELRRRSSLR